MRYRLVAADMDGTLLNSKNQITDATVRAVRRITDSGVIFTIATGRPVQGVEKYNRLLRLTGPVITYNGAVIVNALSHERLFECNLLRDDAKRIIELGTMYDTTICIWSRDQLYGNRLDERIHEYKQNSGVEPLPAEDYEQLLDDGITKILWYDDAEKIQRMQNDLSADMFSEVTYCITTSARPETCFVQSSARVSTYLEFYSGKASKAGAMKIIGEIYGIRREEMIAIGDGLNDLDMIQYAGLGIAMENADVEVRKKARSITSSNDDDGVRKVLEKYFE